RQMRMATRTITEYKSATGAPGQAGPLSKSLEIDCVEHDADTIGRNLLYALDTFSTPVIHRNVLGNSWKKEWFIGVLLCVMTDVDRRNRWKVEEGRHQGRMMMAVDDVR